MFHASDNLLPCLNMVELVCVRTGSHNKTAHCFHLPGKEKEVYKEALFCHFSRKMCICYTAPASNSVKPKTWNKDNSIQSILPPSLVNLLVDKLSGIPWHLTAFPWHFLLDTTSLGIKAPLLLHNHKPWRCSNFIEKHAQKALDLFNINADSL